MFTILLTARSCPTILLSSRRSKSRTSELLISGSRRTSSEKYGLTIALHLVPVFPMFAGDPLGSASTCNVATHLPIATPSPVWTGRPPFRWNRHSPKGRYRQLDLTALVTGLD